MGVPNIVLTSDHVRMLTGSLVSLDKVLEEIPMSVRKKQLAKARTIMFNALTEHRLQVAKNK